MGGLSEEEEEIDKKKRGTRRKSDSVIGLCGFLFYVGWLCGGALKYHREMTHRTV